jgi:protein-tyrosine phosphatase
MYWLKQIGAPRLTILPRPRGGDWLEDEVRNLRVEGVDVLVSALTPPEIKELNLEKEPDYCIENGISFRSFPILDRDIPDSFGAVRYLAKELSNDLIRGKSVAIHCRAGIGRSSLLAACTLVVMGFSADGAFEMIREARGCTVPDTDLQRAWVDKFAQQAQTAMPER